MNVNVEMEATSCPTCGVTFMLPASLIRKLRDSGDGFKCPSGHGIVFKPSEADKLRTRIADLEQQLASAQRSVKWADDRADGARRTWRCPMDGCDFKAKQRPALRRHLQLWHGIDTENRRKALPANAGPSS